MLLCVCMYVSYHSLCVSCAFSSSLFLLLTHLFSKGGSHGGWVGRWGGSGDGGWETVIRIYCMNFQLKERKTKEIVSWFSFPRRLGPHFLYFLKTYDRAPHGPLTDRCWFNFTGKVSLSPQMEYLSCWAVQWCLYGHLIFILFLGVLSTLVSSSLPCFRQPPTCGLNLSASVQSRLQFWAHYLSWSSAWGSGRRSHGC